MANKDWKMAIVDFLLPELNIELTKVKGENETMALKIFAKNSEFEHAQNLITDLTEINKGLRNDIIELKKPKVTALEKYCSATYPEIENIRYNQKRKIKGKYFAVELNQFITPNQFEVQKFRKKLKLSGSLFTDAKIIGDNVALKIKWTDDKNMDTSGDYYSYAEEVLCMGEEDCESHAAVVSSINPEIGIAYGFLLNEKGEKIGGHAFNIFVYAGSVYILDTVGNSATIQLYNGQYYSINYIITQNKTYAVDSSCTFGSIAGWD